MIILIHGRKRSGKDTCADILLELEPSFTRYAFAGPLKFITAKAFDLSPDMVEYLKNNEDIKIGFKSANEKMCTGNSLRNFLQNLGTEAMKPVFGEEVWAKLMYDKYLSSPEGSNFIVTDFRVIEEYNYLAARDAEMITIKIVRDEVDESGDEHITENSLSDFKFDYVIDNNGTLDDLRVELVDLLDKINKG